MKAIKIQSISKDETQIWKAIGIILIALHNYFRWVKPITGENEFGMSRGYLENSLFFVYSNPLEIINVFFNFLGHYGVQIFIFLSAYGLTKVYLSKNESWKKIVVRRFVKLYPTLLLATFAMILFNVAAHANLPNKKLLVSYLAQLSLFSTLIPGKALSAVGPWWFYSMIFQFYLIFPGLLLLFKRFKGKGLIVLSILAYGLIIFINPYLNKASLNILHTAIGHLPEFCLGIWVASKKDFSIHWSIYILAIVVFIFGNIYKEAWYFSHISAIVVLIPIMQWVVKQIGKYSFIHKILSFIGLVSVYVFAVHGFLRWEFVGLANFLNHPVAEFLVGIMFLVFSTGIAWLLFNTENQIRTWIKKSTDGRKRNMKLLMLFVLMAGLVLSVKSCESINYAKKQKQKLENKTEGKVAKILDFESGIDSKHALIDSVAFKGKNSCLITEDREYGPVIRIDVKDLNLDKIKEIKVSCAIHQSNATPKDIHAILELRKSRNNARLSWKNKTFANSKFINNWGEREFVFNVEPEFMRPQAFMKFYIWNNSNTDVLIDEFKVEIIYFK